MNIIGLFVSALRVSLDAYFHYALPVGPCKYAG